MPLTYFAMLAAAWALNPGLDPIRHEPSELGRAGAHAPWIYNGGMIATALLGLAGAVGLWAVLRQRRASAVLNLLTGLSLILASCGLGMAGLLTPMLGAVALWRLGDRRAAGILGGLVPLIVALALGGAPPVIVGALMLAATSRPVRAPWQEPNRSRHNFKKLERVSSESRFPFSERALVRNAVWRKSWLAQP